MHNALEEIPINYARCWAAERDRWILEMHVMVVLCLSD